MPLPQLVVFTLHPEFAEEILLAHGAQSVTQVDAADDPVLEPAPGEAPLWPRTRTIGLFEQGADLAPAIAALRSTLPDGDAAIGEADRMRAEFLQRGGNGLRSRGARPELDLHQACHRPSRLSR